MGALARGGAPVVTFGFIGLCVALYLVQLADPDFTFRFAFVPQIGMAEPWRYLTSALLHSPTGLISFHLLLNMYCMWILGQGLEPQLGRIRYTVVLILTAMGGSVTYQLIAGSDSLTYLIGASGIVFGLFGFLLTAGRALGLQVRGILVVVVINGVFGFIVPGIAWQGHLGGLAVGCLLGFLYTSGPKNSRTTRQIAGSVATAAALVAAAYLG